MGQVHARLVAAVGVLVLVGTTALTAPSAAAAAAAQPYDVNGDGFADLVVGVPGEDGGSAGGRGAVNVIYGSTAGLTPSGDQLWSQNSRGVPGSGRAGDELGTPASGDFDGDGFADLAVGAPGDRVSGHPGAGAVNVFYGSAKGLRSQGSRLFSQATSGVPGTAGDGDAFGETLVSGDFDGDGRDDLAIGAPRDSIGSDDNDRGSVTVLFGSRTGLRSTGAQEWDTGSILVNGIGLVGRALDAGDINGDGRDELAVLAPGFVMLLIGTPSGLTSIGSAQVWDAVSTGTAAAMQKPGQISSLTFGDFNGDQHLDLAIGSLGANRSRNEQDDCSVLQQCDGAVAIVPGSADPSQLLTTTGLQVLHPGLLSLGTYDLGRTLAAGDVDGDGRDELFATAGGGANPREVVGVHFAAGTGIEADGSKAWTQGPSQVSGTYEEGDDFGEFLQVAQLGGSSEADLAIGIPGETVDGAAGAGRVAVLYGSADGVTAAGQQSWSQASPGINGKAEAGDRFGTLGR